MLRDAITLVPDQALEADICVVGAGPAGLAFALSVTAKGRSCLILESGLDGPSEEHNALGHLDHDYAFGNLKERHVNEIHQIGGKSNAWSIESSLGQRGVRLLPYAPVNFEARAEMGAPAWPFKRAALDPFYKEAADFFRIPADGWDLMSNEPIPFSSEDVSIKRFRFSDGEVLSARIRNEIVPSPDITLLYRANVLEIKLNAEGTAVETLSCASAPGRAFTVKAKQFVLAAGGLATTAILLRSTAHHPRGVGNQHDQVGRYFMDHPLIDGGQIHAHDPGIFDRATPFDLTTDRSGVQMAHLQLREDLLQDGSAAAMCAMLYPRPRPRDLSRLNQHNRRVAQRAFQALKDPREPLSRRVSAIGDLMMRPDQIADDLRRKKEAENARINRGGWSAAPGASARYRVFDVLHICEQPPRADNRVVLGKDRDAFGQARVNINWTWSKADQIAVQRSQALFADAISKSGAASYEILDDDGAPEIVHSSLGHHIGTTRMHADPRQGVTDGNAKVHGLSNLFIASSSLFTSGGWENPTLTIVALAQRLAQHLCMML